MTQVTVRISLELTTNSGAKQYFEGTQEECNRFILMQYLQIRQDCEIELINATVKLV